MGCVWGVVVGTLEVLRSSESTCANAVVAHDHGERAHDGSESIPSKAGSALPIERLERDGHVLEDDLAAPDLGHNLDDAIHEQRVGT